MSANELSALLWREREFLELLEFKLETQQLMLTTGKSRWVQRCADEIASVSAKLRQLNLARDLSIVSLAEEWGVDENASLRQIVEGARETVWVDIFNAHLVALVDLLERIKVLRDANELLLRAASRSAQETLAVLDRSVSTYDSRGHAGSQPATAQLIDKDI